MSGPWWDLVRRQLETNRRGPEGKEHANDLRRVLQAFVTCELVSGADLHLVWGRPVKGAGYEVALRSRILLDARGPGGGLILLDLALTATAPRGAVRSFVISLYEDGDHEPLIAVHLDEPGKGDGACSHALLHCHPRKDDHELRVPLSALSAPDALRWLLLSLVDDAHRSKLEPAPWACAPADVQEHLPPR